MLYRLRNSPSRGLQGVSAPGIAPTLGGHAVVEAEKSEHFVRPVDGLAAGAINSAASRVGLLLGFS